MNLLTKSKSTSIDSQGLGKLLAKDKLLRTFKKDNTNITAGTDDFSSSF